MKAEKKRERGSMRERLCHTLDIQPDIFPGGTLVEVRGRNYVRLCGCGAVTHYTDSKISFCAREGEISVYGKRLCCSSYRRGMAVVDGYIECVCFEEEKC